MGRRVLFCQRGDSYGREGGHNDGYALGNVESVLTANRPRMNCGLMGVNMMNHVGDWFYADVVENQNRD